MDGFKQPISFSYISRFVVLLTLGFGLPVTTAAAAVAVAAPARDPIVHDSDNLVTVLAQESHPHETLLGMIMAVDQQNDQITMEVASGIDSTFKVQDALIFNAVHHGDYVEVTVESIGGTKTIVGVKKL